MVLFFPLHLATNKFHISATWIWASIGYRKQKLQTQNFNPHKYSYSFQLLKYMDIDFKYAPVLPLKMALSLP